MRPPVTGETVVAGVAGAPVRHSLSPLIHNAWLDALGLDGAYVPFSPPADGFRAFADGLRCGAVRGLNVTLPFKEQALAVADAACARAKAAAAANLLIFEPDGSITADNTDGLGLLAALRAQAPGFDPKAGPAVILGAGGAARGGVAALLEAGAPEVRIVNRTLAKAEMLAGALDGGRIRAFALDRAAAAFEGANVIIGATSAALSADPPPPPPLETTPPTAVIMDMVYRPLETPLLAAARRLGRPTVDGLEMLIRQAEPSFAALFGRAPPADVDVRSLALARLGETACS